MKKIYWRPQRISRPALILITVLSLSLLTAVETFPLKVKQPYYPEKIAAARLARQGFDLIKTERLKRQLPIDDEADPAQSGLIGQAITSVTSDTGFLPAKHTSINPNFAAVIVHYLRRIGVGEGDIVAVGTSGSFPALNIATYAALQTLKAKPIIIASAAASQWGANLPEFLWLDMEKILVDAQLFPFRSVAASRGGTDDRGFGMSREGREILDAAIARHGLRTIQADSIEDGIVRRMQIYQELAGKTPIKAYINIGGGTASVGTVAGKKMFKPGLNRQPPRGEELIDSVMTRFIKNNTPVIHLVYVAELAKRNGFPLDPKQIPPVGEGKIFIKAEYNLWLTIGSLILVIVVMIAFLRLNLGFRLIGNKNVSPTDAPANPDVPQQMV